MRGDPRSQKARVQDRSSTLMSESFRMLQTLWRRERLWPRFQSQQWMKGSVYECVCACARVYLVRELNNRNLKGQVFSVGVEKWQLYLLTLKYRCVFHGIYEVSMVVKEFAPTIWGHQGSCGVLAGITGSRESQKAKRLKLWKG